MADYVNVSDESNLVLEIDGTEIFPTAKDGEAKAATTPQLAVYLGVVRWVPNLQVKAGQIVHHADKLYRAVADDSGASAPSAGSQWVVVAGPGDFGEPVQKVLSKKYRESSDDFTAGSILFNDEPDGEYIYLEGDHEYVKAIELQNKFFTDTSGHQRAYEIRVKAIDATLNSVACVKIGVTRLNQPHSWADGDDVDILCTYAVPIHAIPNDSIGSEKAKADTAAEKAAWLKKIGIADLRGPLVATFAGLKSNASIPTHNWSIESSAPSGFKNGKGNFLVVPKKRPMVDGVTYSRVYIALEQRRGSSPDYIWIEVDQTIFGWGPSYESSGSASGGFAGDGGPSDWYAMKWRADNNINVAAKGSGSAARYRVKLYLML